MTFDSFADIMKHRIIYIDFKLVKGYDNMKKTFFRIITAFALIGILSTSAMAEGTIEVFNDEGQITVKVSNLEPNEETTLLVVKGSATISQAFSDVSKIYHMDQLPSDSKGVSTFNFNYSGTDSMTIYSGYATMGIDDDPYKTVLDESTPQTPGAEFTYGDVNNDTSVDLIDAGAVVQYALKGESAPFKDANTNEVYEQGVQAADVNGDTSVDLIDAGAIVQKALKGTEFPVDSSN